MLCCLLLAGGDALAQGTNASLGGTVQDPTGAVIPGANVTVQNINTGITYDTISNEAGIYRFPSLQPGTYKITAEMPGFKTLVYNEVKLDVMDRMSLNLQLELGQQSETVEVTAGLETQIGLLNTSIGGMVTNQMVKDLPLGTHNVLGLTTLQAGTQGDYFGAARIGTLNISRDGVNVQDQRINSGIASTIYTSTDLIEEFRVVTSPADAEYGRGSGQIQMITRSGNNEFHGAAWNLHRNTVLNANTWFNNQRGRDADGKEISPRSRLIRNQFGGRLGGPIIKNKTFFHVTYDGQRERSKGSVTSTVLTAKAREGIFRFFPGVLNANAIAAVPTVDLQGNPVRPATATGDLQEVSLFGRDPNRMAADPTGVIKKLLALTPLPNNFRTGNGLNTAGYTWTRTATSDWDNLSMKFDHHFNQNHRLNFSYTHERGSSMNAFMAQPFPDSPGGDNMQRDHFYAMAFTSTLRPTLLNEFRVGILRPLLRFNAPWELAGTDLQPKIGNQPYMVDFGVITDPLDLSNDPQGRISPSYQFSNNITWMKGKHNFVGGAEIRFVSTNGFNSFTVMPRAFLGTGGVSVANISTITGIGGNSSNAQAILNDLTGTLSQLSQAFNSPGGASPEFLAGEGKRRTWQQREFAGFFKDTWRVTPRLTLNLGVRYEFYTPPVDANGKAVGIVGGSAGLFGVTGTGFADLFQPGLAKGSLTNLELVGKNSPNPGKRLYNPDRNNFAPAVGFSWSIPYFGENKTVLRAGYSWGYERGSLRIVDVVAGDQPGLRTVRNFTTSSLLNLQNAVLPLVPLGKPLETVPLTDRTQTVRAFDSNLRNPYHQNWNLSIQRELPQNFSLEVRYVGSKGTRMWRGTNINERNIFENGLLDAFMLTQAGGNSALLNQIFMGVNVSGLGVVNGTTITGSDVIRFNSTTQGYLHGNHVATFANWLATTTTYTSPSQVGGNLTRAKLPDNYVFANPQFTSANLTGNFANSTYHSLQVEVSRRFSGGLQFQGNYTWSKALGEEEGEGQEMLDSYRTLRNRSFDKRVLAFSVEHVFRNNGTYELPLGPGKRFLNSTNPVISRLVERWTVGAIFNLFSGSPLSLTSGAATFNTFGDNTPDLVGNFPKSMGKVLVTGTGVKYFDGLQLVADPYIQNITTLRGIQGMSTMKAIADASGKILLQNPKPGTNGNLGHRYITGPGSFRLDVNLIKRISLFENKHLEFRATALNLTNTPQWGNPNTDINSTGFGNITSAGGNRIVVVEARISF